ncbi:MAG: hypothetical protein KF787_02705 [Phycisphaeraceae bacterium]|nr:hypothetical protein [Phycisphaeraceae bacterium]HRJ50121.1 hypothetical protein [Phycisphaerales bacterium]
MSETARIQNLDILRDVRAALLDFAHEAGLCMTAVGADVERVGQWLTLDRPHHWRQEIRRREEAIEAAKAEIRRKELAAFPNPADTTTERVALRRCRERFERAQHKQDRVRTWLARWERESTDFKGGFSSLNQVVHAQIPAAVARLDRMIQSLEEYLRTAPPTSSQATPAGSQSASQAGSMSRGEMPDDPPPPPLRACVPTESARLDIPDTPLPRLDWRAGEPTDSEREALARMDLADSPPLPDQFVTFSWRAIREPTVFLIRTPPAAGDPRDSGWYIGTAEDPANSSGTRACRVRELIEQVPGLATLLTLREGCLVVLHRGAIRSVLDPDDHEVWLSADGPTTR